MRDVITDTYFPFISEIGLWKRRSDFGQCGEVHDIEGAQLCLKQSELHTECFRVCEDAARVGLYLVGFC